MLRMLLLIPVSLAVCACGSGSDSHPKPLYLAIPDSSLECINGLLPELKREHSFESNLLKLAVPPSGAVLFKHVLQLSSETDNEQKSVAVRIISSLCLLQQAEVYKAHDRYAANRILDRINTRDSGVTVYLDFVDDEVYVYLHSPPSPEEQFWPAEVSEDDAKTMGLRP